MKWSIGVVLSSVILLFSGLVQAREVSIMTVDWPPYYAQKLEDNGPIASVTREAFKAKGHTIKIQFVPWKRALEEVKQGRADMVLGAYDTEDRRRLYIYSDKTYELKDLVIGLASNGVTSFSTLEDLKGYTFGVTRGYAYSKEFEEAAYLSREVVSTDVLNLRKLFANRIQFIVMNTATFKGNLKLIAEKDRKEYVFLSPPLSVNGLHNIFSRKVKDSPQLVEDFNAGSVSYKHLRDHEKVLDLV